MALFYRATKRSMTIGANPGTRSYDFSHTPERQKCEDFLESIRVWLLWNDAQPYIKLVVYGLSLIHI